MSEPEVVHKVNIRDLSIQCGQCRTYQTLTDFEACDGFNRYTYECENETCETSVTRTLVGLEVPRGHAVDGQFAIVRQQAWRAMANGQARCADTDKFDLLRTPYGDQRTVSFFNPAR